MNEATNPIGANAASSAGAGAGSSGGSDQTSSSPAGGDRKFDRAVHATHEAVDRAAASLDQAAERMRAQYDHMCSVEQEWAEHCRVRVREHPLACVAVAALAGMLIGRLTSRH